MGSEARLGSTAPVEELRVLITTVCMGTVTIISPTLGRFIPKVA